MIHNFCCKTQPTKTCPLKRIRLGGVFLLLMVANVGNAEDHLVDFEEVEVGKPIAKWNGNGVQVELAHPPKKSKAIGRITFFPHLGTGHKGVVNAMATEAIPIRASFERNAHKVKVKLWGSTTSAAYIEAFDQSGVSLAKKAIEKVPVRQSPEDPIPFFELSIESPNIAFVEIGGSKPGGYVAIDELRWVTQ